MQSMGFEPSEAARPLSRCAFGTDDEGDESSESSVTISSDRLRFDAMNVEAMGG